MRIAEQYSIARHTSNLKSEPRTASSASDVIAAAGMAAQDNATAMMLWEITFRGRTQAKLALVEVLAQDLTVYMLRSRLKGDPRRIAMEVLAWWLHGTCQPCGGRGLQTILGTPVLSDDLCTHCYGSGKLPLPTPEPYRWLHDRMSKLSAIAAGKVMQKLALDMDLW